MTNMIILSISNIICFLIGAIVGQRVNKGKEVITTPSKVIQEHKQKKEKKFEEEYFKTIMDNIDAYDGSELGQKDIPKRG